MHIGIPPRPHRRARSDVLPRSPQGATRHWQIGPRIRVGGSVGKIGQNVKIAAGKALSNPYVDGALALIPGVGPGISAAAGAAGRVLDTSDGGLHGVSGIGSLASGAAKGYAAGWGAEKLAGMLGGLGGGSNAVGSAIPDSALGIGDGGLTGTVKSAAGMLGLGGNGKGIGGSGLTLADILGFAGNTAAGVADFSQNEAARKQAAEQFAQSLEQRKAEAAQQGSQFDKTYGITANTQAIGAADRLNRAPLADKGQYLALNHAAPVAFQPRDYTRTGMPQQSAPPIGGAQAQLAANEAAQANYKAGAGGVNTDTLKMILSRLGYPGGASPARAPGAPSLIG